ncbi:MAG: hypothetical protein KKA79_04580 [Nanoarchaeota archaeon]|nr:hypothetical protein [Nanoarchaeota archaeon]MCG2718956.1 hypothetical protein [Nanoarchaeota archaeon]
MRYKKLVITGAIITSFMLGIGFSEPIKDMKKYFHHEAAEGFYKQPYNLEVRTRENIEGKIESYLYNKETNEHHKIGLKMYVGNTKYRMESLGDAVKEEIKEKLEFIPKIYRFIFD